MQHRHFPKVQKREIELAEAGTAFIKFVMEWSEKYKLSIAEEHMVICGHLYRSICREAKYERRVYKGKKKRPKDSE